MSDDGYRKVGSLFVPEQVTETQPIVIWFGQEMERRLARDKHKDKPTLWRTTDVFSLKKCLDEQVRVLKAAIDDNPKQVFTEAAGVANLAMMIADWYESRMDQMDIDGSE